MAPIRCEPLAEDALLLHVGEGIAPDTSDRVLAATAVLARALPGVECVPAYASVLLRFDAEAWRTPDGPAPHQAVREAAMAALASPDAASPVPREVTVPVCYGGDAGPDLDEVARLTGLGADEVVARHAAGHYRVAMLGFAPGFPYLLGLDPVLAVPRRADPRTRVPAGSVAIGGAQTGIYPDTLPGGWQLIGRTPLRLFDPAADEPTALRPGDRVRFAPIDAARFDALRTEAWR
ncbi:5-oxoprolinase subunit PxpB [Dyella ginsengisoli]|uniref:5-oxoprolinase subunit PxpB n=1 Tax=Dyella ginsengisoli TaxID=363848 RepID=UPI000345D198|nr:5-oxoprolinase subunit PxpB [Dyella ginsengisoli]